nr:hypothetical protein [uncultured Agrobacterium sp.]
MANGNENRTKALDLGAGSQVTIGSLNISGCDVGVSAEGASLTVNSASFDNVGLPYDLRNMHDVSIQNTKITRDPKIKDGGRTFAGWQPIRQGPALPSYCPKCEHVFASHNYYLSGLFFNLWKNEEPCINCGYPNAVLSEGHFKLVQESVEILRSPEITKQMVKRLAELGDAVASGRLKPEEAIAAAEEIHPMLGRAAALLFTGLTYAYFMYASIIGTVSATMDLYDRVKGADPAVINQRVIEQVLREHDRLWHEKLQHPQGNVVGEHPGRNPDKIATSNKAGSKITQPGSGSGQDKKKKQKRKQLKKHRQSFGGARSR